MTDETVRAPLTMEVAVDYCDRMICSINRVGDWGWDLGLRFILAWEFYEAGIMKLEGENWFMAVADKFPWPLNVLPAEVSWQMATWFEIIGAVGLLAGLATRFFAASLIVLTIVAIKSVHWPESFDSVTDLAMGYAISDSGHGNFKLPVILLVMLVPFVVRGAGKFSMDHWIDKQYLKG
ncbi:MAG: DoxX family protein [Sphingomonadales bacterium]|nr:DoxX family protein [Sphingomonadales bacterium]